MAKRFRFRLEPMLRLRQQQADQAKRVVAERLRRISSVQQEIGLLERQITQQIAAMRSGPMVGSLDVGTISRHRAWLTHLQGGVLAGMTRVRQLQAELVTERASLGEATKLVKILETLRDRQADRYYKELDRQELIEADEMSVQRYVFARQHEA